MNHYKKHKRNPLFDEKQGEVFISFLDDEQQKKIAQLIFVEGMTNLEVAEKTNFSVRSIDRIRVDIMKIVLLNLIEKQTPKKVELYTNDGNFKWQNYPCPCCKEMLGLNVNKRYVKFCQNCGQALDWSDTECPIKN